MYYDFGPPAEDRSDEGLMREKHYALVVQSDSFTKHPHYPMVVVLAMTSKKPKGSAIGWLQIEPSPQNGLEMTTYLEAKKFYTIRKSDISRVVGRLEWTLLQQLKGWLLDFFSLRN